MLERGVRRCLTLRDEGLNPEIFTTLTEAQILIERWRREYNIGSLREPSLPPATMRPPRAAAPP